ncbi:MAG: YbaB/EbfC family nucleoid-associated protein [Clostridia bacterium]|nr:YbaB/EbfC family nucleoid-associated protein [Clostridia bacterium]
MKARIPNQPNRADLVKKLQEMQDNMQKAQEEVENTEFEASAGGDAVTVTVTGKHEVKSVKIKPEVVDPEDVEMLEDFITIAVNGAVAKAEAAMEQAMGEFSGAGLPQIPGLGM